jgi:DNA-binding MarR family transcriptional regulator
LEYAVLSHLDAEPDIDLNGLAARLGVEQSHGSVLVDRLTQMRLVERRINDADRRARLLCLTAQGTKLYQRLRRAAPARQNRMLAPLTAAERETLLDLLVKVIKGNEAYARPGAGRRKRGSQPSSSSGRTR